ncbi:MAG: AzlD domain-containing protein [Clostridia bacterium]|nr:AzlD domain-containing protein [Clostridia bacterium]
MNPTYFFTALLVMAGVTYLIRLLPLLFIRRRITNRFIRSFLYYVPYAVLSAIAFPAIFLSTGSLISGILATVVCLLLAYRGKGLIACMLGSIATVLIAEGLLLLI